MFPLVSPEGIPRGIHPLQKQFVQTDFFFFQGLVPYPVFHFIRIRIQIIKFIRGVKKMDGQLVASVKNGPHHLNAAETVVVNLIPGKFRNDKIIYPDLRVIYLRQEAFALKTFRDGQIHILHDHGRLIWLTGFLSTIPSGTPGPAIIRGILAISLYMTGPLAYRQWLSRASPWSDV